MAREVYPSEPFKEKSKKFVLVKINSDQQPSVSAQYEIKYLPTIKFIRPDGTVVHEFVGYKPVRDFLAEMDAALQAGG